MRRNLISLIVAFISLLFFASFFLLVFLFTLNYEETEEGAGQGSVCSPVIANIYMHYVLVWWFKEKMQPIMKAS